MIPERPDPAVLEDDASIGEGERGRTMCHHHDRHPRAQLAQHEADRPFSFAVECGSALVEEQEGWSSKQAPRNGQSLALAAGQRTSPIPHIVRGFDVLIFEADSVEHLHKGLIAYLFGISVTVQQILPDRALHQPGLLLHQGDMVPELPQVPGRNGQTLDRDLPRAGFGEADEQIEQG